MDHNEYGFSFIPKTPVSRTDILQVSKICGCSDGLLQFTCPEHLILSFLLSSSRYLTQEGIFTARAAQHASFTTNRFIVKSFW